MARIASRYGELMAKSTEDPDTLAASLAAEIAKTYHEPHALQSTAELSRHTVAQFVDWHDGVADPCLDSGFYGLDHFYDGLRIGRVTTFAMLSGSGKTSALTQIANAVANRSANQGPEAPAVLLFSAEMDAKELVNRIASQRAGVDLRQIRTSEAGFRALVHEARNVRSLPIYIDEHPAPTVEYMRARVQWLTSKRPVALIGFDYVEKTGERNPSEELRISQAIRGYAALCKEYDIPGICLAQLNRNYAMRGRMRPVISDIRYSGMIEQESYMVILNYSPAALVDKGFQCKDYVPEDPGLCWWIVAKNRGGETGTIPMRFTRQTTTFQTLGAPGHYRQLSHNPYDG